MKEVTNYIKNKLSLLVAVTLAAVVGGVSTSLVMAAIPDDNGVIHGCIRPNNSNLRIIDTEAGQTCTGGQTPISWDQSNGPGNFISNLAGVDFSNYDLRYRDFSGSNLQTTSFESANLKKVNFSGANLNQANLNGASMLGVDFTNATFQNTTLTNSLLDDSILDGADFSNAILSSSSLQNVQAIGTDFSSAIMNGMNAEGMNLTNANLLGVIEFPSGFTIIWSNTLCPDGTNSNNNGGTCEGHL